MKEFDDLELRVYGDADEFTGEWQQLGYTANEAEQYWALLSELKPTELLIQLPEWLAAEKIGFIDGATPTEFVGRIDTESERAIRFTASAAARPLSRLAHRIQSLENGINRLQDEGDPDPDRMQWLQRQLNKKRRAIDAREDVPALSDEWLPKSQIEFIGRRAPDE